MSKSLILYYNYVLQESSLVFNILITFKNDSDFKSKLSKCMISN